MSTTLSQQDVLILVGMCLVAQLGWQLVSKIVWDWLRVGRSGASKATKLEEAPVTLGDMEKHCEKSQEACRNVICVEISGMAKRLERGDSRFGSLDRRYQRLERGLSGIRNQLSEIIRSNGKAERLEGLLQQILGEIEKAKEKERGG